MAEVTLQGIRKAYPNGYVAVESLDLQIRDREFMVLVGPSGCGKSTTLRMIAGLESISSGTLSIDGRRVNEVPPKDRDIAMVFQAYALYPHMTVAENMGFPLKMRKVAAAEIARKVQEAAEILDIAHLLARHPKALSGGQKQRVALGRAIVRQPKVFLLDEPLSNLDAKLRVQMRAELGKLHRRLQVTMIYVTHDQVEAMTLGDRITVMNGGAIQQVDTPKTVYERPANRFVAGFIGSPPMNFFDVTLSRCDDGWLASGDGFELRLDGPLAAVAAAHDGGAAVLGVRPEDLSVRSGGEGAGGRSVRAQVEVLEPVGGEAYVHLRLGAAPLVARVARYEGIAEGEPLDVVLDLERARLFGAEGGEAWTA